MRFCSKVLVAPVWKWVAGLLCAGGWVMGEPVPNTPGALRMAIGDLQEKFGEAYPDATLYLNRLALEGNQSGEGFFQLQKEALLAHPLIGTRPILFVERPQYLYEHHNTETMYQTGEICVGKYRPGGSLKLLDPVSGESRVLFDPGTEGHLRDPDLHADGRRVVFSMRKSIADDYHLYEIAVDGSGFRQLTSSKGIFDIDPCYLPDGGIVFTSSRNPKYCGCNRHIMGNLFRMEEDGANIHQVGKSSLFEGHAAVMPDGRVLYDRWEYVDRNFGDAQGLWTMNPDGTNHAVFWGNNTPSPGGVIDARIIPKTGLALCIFTSCHDSPWGALAIVDRSRGVDGRESVVRTWPASAIKRVGKGNYDEFKKVSPKYEDPWPVSETTFLVSRQLAGNGSPMGIYLIDTFGNEVLVHAEGRGCFDPMLLGARGPAPVRPMARSFGEENGMFYVQDVNVGTHMKGVDAGVVKSLRVVEVPEKRSWTKSGWNGQGQQAPAMNWHSFENKRILGTVPVEEDGSVYFECPPDRFVYFQLLDEDGMMVQSMRSGTIIQPGEVQGCVGCHDDRNDSAPACATSPQAMLKSPTKLEGWGKNAGTFSYQREVQPIFDRHCVSCHDYRKPAGEKLNLAGDRTLVFNASYTDLWSRGYLSCIGGGPAEIQAAGSWGARPSKLIQALLQEEKVPTEHQDLELSQAEMETLVTWVDLNAPYYPTHESAYPDNYAGRSPLKDREMKRLASLTGADFVKGHSSVARAQVSFERPELSRCLVGLDAGSNEYQEALGIIERGGERLVEVPRCDMEGFEPCEVDRKRLLKYLQRAQIETANRKAIREGKRVYDDGHSDR